MDEFDAPPKRPKAVQREPPGKPVDPPIGELLCREHDPPGGYWRTPTGWLGISPTTPVDRVYAWAVVSIVGGPSGRLVASGTDFGILEEWCRRKAGRHDYSRDFEIRPMEAHILRQKANPPARI